jgi:hypothetical protein
MLFQASHFADVKGSWGISFTVWSEGKTDKTRDIPVTLKDVVDYTVVTTGDKAVYNSEGREASDWVREPTKGLKGVDAPQMSSGLGIEPHPSTKYTGQIIGSVGYLHSDSNSVANSATLTFWLSSASSHGHGLSVLPGESFRRCTALYAARKLVTDAWSIHTDEYLAPTDTVDAYRQWNDDAVVYALLHGKNNCTAMRDVQYKGKAWRIKNHWFWRTREESRALYDRPDTQGLYSDVRGETEDSYLATIITGLDLSPEARECLALLDTLLVSTLPHRDSFATSRPELHLGCHDAGVYQLKTLFRDYDPAGWAKLQVAFKALAARLRPGVYGYGFLRA